MLCNYKYYWSFSHGYLHPPPPLAGVANCMKWFADKELCSQETAFFCNQSFFPIPLPTCLCVAAFATIKKQTLLCRQYPPLQFAHCDRRAWDVELLPDLFWRERWLRRLKVETVGACALSVLDATPPNLRFASSASDAQKKTKHKMRCQMASRLDMWLCIYLRLQSHVHPGRLAGPVHLQHNSLIYSLIFTSWITSELYSDRYRWRKLANLINRQSGKKLGCGGGGANPSDSLPTAAAPSPVNQTRWRAICKQAQFRIQRFAQLRVGAFRQIDRLSGRPQHPGWAPEAPAK